VVNNKELEPIGGTISVVNLPVAMLTASNMPMRDYFAAKAMQNQISNPLKLGDDEAHRLIAERSFRMADAMLIAREQK